MIALDPVSLVTTEVSTASSVAFDQRVKQVQDYFVGRPMTRSNIFYEVMGLFTASFRDAEVEGFFQEQIIRLRFHYEPVTCFFTADSQGEMCWSLLIRMDVGRNDVAFTMERDGGWPQRKPLVQIEDTVEDEHD